MIYHVIPAIIVVALIAIGFVIKCRRIINVATSRQSLITNFLILLMRLFHHIV